MQSLDTDIQSLGGGGMGGFGGGGYNPLLWLITLGFLGGRNGLLGGGNEAGAAAVGANSAKIDCLQQGQSFLQNSLNQQTQSQESDRINDNISRSFVNLNDNINNLSGIQRDVSDTIFRQTTLLSQQNAQENNATLRTLAECCCDLKSGQQSIETAIAMQTNDLNTVSTAQTQRILDAINDNKVAALEAALAERTSQLNIAETVKQISENCGCCNGTQGGGGTTVDINVILAALLRNQGATSSAPGNSGNTPASI
jgi:hypothetical protein